MTDHSLAIGRRCPVCRSTELMECIDLMGVPVHCSALCTTRREAFTVARGDIQLAFCCDCGHLFNTVFDPDLVEYSAGYETSLHFSGRFQNYAQDTANYLIERYDLRGKRVLEIGCGQGEFLALLCEGGDNYGVGIDPSYVAAPGGPSMDPRLELIQDHYSRKYAERRVDLTCCRHVLEHLAAPRDLLQVVRDTIGEESEAIVFFEVPNVLYTLRDMGIWDIIYEHCSYFSPSSLRRIFNACGFNVLDLREAYDEQFLCIEALAASESAAGQPHRNTGMQQLKALVAAFGERYWAKVASWERELARMADTGRRVAVWGGGSKGVTFLNTVIGGKEVDCVVDVNRRKQGMFIPGTGQPIVAPDQLLGRKVDAILVMNPIYRDEVESQARTLGLTAEMFCV